MIRQETQTSNPKVFRSKAFELPETLIREFIFPQINFLITLFLLERLDFCWFAGYEVTNQAVSAISMNAHFYNCDDSFPLF